MTIYQETQRYHQPLAIGLLIFFSVLSLYRLSISILHDHGTLGLSALCVLLIGFSWYCISHFRMSIRIKRKKIIIRAPGSFLGKRKLRFRDIKQIEFLTFSLPEMWSGALVHLSSDYHLLDFGDHKGVYIVMNNGEKFLILSNQLFDRQNEIGLPTDLAQPILQRADN